MWSSVSRWSEPQNETQMKKKKERGRVLRFQLSDPIWSSLSPSFSLSLNLNETSDFEAVARSLKVCQWDSASELERHLEIGRKQSGRQGPRRPAGQRRCCCTSMCVGLCVCVGEQLKATTCIVRRWTAPAANPSGATRPVHPNLPSNRDGVCVCVCIWKKGGRFNRGEEVRGEEAACC